MSLSVLYMAAVVTMTVHHFRIGRDA